MKRRLYLLLFISLILMKCSFSSALLADETNVPDCKGETMTDVEKLIPNAIMDIRYATENNFLKTKVYTNAKCFLRKSVAQNLKLVADDLQNAGYRLVLWDCYRPLSVQKKMWKIHPVKGEVANPKTGSNHNRGAAVDVALADKNGKLVEMPSKFDEFSKKAWKNTKQGISAVALKHRTILQNAMLKHGFKGIKREWWHFNATDCKKYPICEAEF